MNEHRVRSMPAAARGHGRRSVLPSSASSSSSNNRGQRQCLSPAGSSAPSVREKNNLTISDALDASLLGSTGLNRAALWARQACCAGAGSLQRNDAVLLGQRSIKMTFMPMSALNIAIHLKLCRKAAPLVPARQPRQPVCLPNRCETASGQPPSWNRIDGVK